MVYGGDVMVSTRYELSRYTEVRIYDIAWYHNRQETMQYILYHNHPRADEIRAVIQQDYWPLLPPVPVDPAQSLFGSDDSDDSGYSRSAGRVDQLQMLIEMTVGQPDDWIDGMSTMLEIDGNLVIETTPDSHREIASLLTILRES